MSPSRGGRGRGVPAGGARPHAAVKRGGSSQNTRVVWPPAERTETARDAIERVLREADRSAIDTPFGARGGIATDRRSKGSPIGQPARELDAAREFDAEVEREAQRSATRAWECAKEEARVDLRELPTFTVDPATARDFDDAISAEAVESDPAHPAVRVWVHIADVAAHVPLGSPLDLEARRRGTSVYMPGTVEPMLPHVLSSGACSLVPGVERLAVTVELLLRGAQVVQAGFYRSIIRSNERLDYEQVDRIFASGARAPEPWGAPLAAARSAAAALQEARERSGALTIDSEEPEFSFDEDGNVIGIAPRPQTESHRLIEHLMIAANEAVARHLTQARTPCLYRVHERPDPERIRTLVQQLDSLGVSTPPLPDPLFSTQAAELVGEISRRVDAHVRRTGHGRVALSSLVLRSLKQACYSPKNLGHAGLHSNCYCHFTSPIRRYPDIVCHRALLSSLGADERITGRRKLVELGEWVSEREREATALERKGDDVAACFRLEQVLLEDGYDQAFTGEVTGLIAAGAFVVFGEVFEGMLPVRLLTAGEERDWWTLDEKSTILRGERSGAVLRLGDPIAVRVVRVDAAAGRVDLAPAV